MVATSGVGLDSVLDLFYPFRGSRGAFSSSSASSVGGGGGETAGLAGAGLFEEEITLFLFGSAKAVAFP